MRKRRFIQIILVFVVLFYPCWFLFTQKPNIYVIPPASPVQNTHEDQYGQPMNSDSFLVQSHPTPPPVQIHSTPETTRGVKIVFWTKVYNSDEWNFLAPCPEHKQCSIGWERCQKIIEDTGCTATFDQKEVENADVVVFDGPQYYREMFGFIFPPRHSHQLWAVLDKEAPISSPIMHDQNAIKIFNMSITYRLSSEAWFGYVDPPALETMFEFPVPFQKKKKDVPAVWIASNCASTSWPREQFVAELMEHVKVDSYGACLHNKDFTQEQLSQNAGVTSFQLVSQYKFYLSFENSQCDDYVTEKYYRALMAGAIPVVVGAPNIAKFAPNNHSIIIASEFGSAKEVADLMNKINEDDELYKHYVSWKLDKKVSKEFEALWTEKLAGCMLTGICDYAHKVKTGKVFHDPNYFPAADNSCI